ncbi:MAG: CHASE3 domain-containing protein [Bacteroidetes bacterium]|nr:CHASE3 domain-containing protein [Bacteroidota bacterium]
MKTIIKKFAIDATIRAGYGTAFFLLLISYLLTLYANRQLLNQSNLMDHTNKVIIHLETMLSAIKDGETGGRGYVITRDTAFLEPYRASRNTTDSLFLLIKKETGNNQSKTERLDALGKMIDKKFELMAFAVNYSPKHNFEITDSLKSAAYHAKEIMDRIRLTVYQMQAEERLLLKNRSDELGTLYRTLNVIVITSLVMAFLLVIYGFITYSRENVARRRADQTVFEYQEQLKQQIEELDRANKELIQMRNIEKLASTGRIARTIAHEVRNPLTNINLSVEQIKSDDLDDDTKLMLDMITRNSNRINQLIADLLNSTKSTELIFQKYPINQLIDETLVLANDRIHLKNIKVEKRYEERIAEVNVDVEKIKIAFLNIIVNAIEAMDSNVGVLKIKTETRNDKCVVTINDNGSGIDKESLTKLFEPYFTSKPKGNGLGLTNTQNIILSHNGYIQVESDKSKGTTFSIILNF